MGYMHKIGSKLKILNFFLNFDFVKRGDSAPLAYPLVAPLTHFTLLSSPADLSIICLAVLSKSKSISLLCSAIPSCIIGFVRNCPV